MDCTLEGSDNMKTRIVLGTLLIAVIFTGCRTQVEYPFMQSEGSIVGIDIVYADPYSYTVDYSAIEPVFAVDQEQWQSFLADFKEIPCKYAPIDPLQGHSGEVIRITYADGGYEVIGPYAGLHVDPKGNWTYKDYYFEKDVFIEFIETIQRDKGQGTVLLSPDNKPQTLNPN